MASNRLSEDLEYILERTRDLWGEMRGGRLFVTGGTGFFGTWLLESFCRANSEFGLGASATVLTRNPEAFVAKAPHLAADPAFRFHVGDVRSFGFPAGEFTHVIHAATPASATLNDQSPLVMLDTIVEGTRRTLDFAVEAGAGKFLLTSSGAVYGAQPPDLTHIPETYRGGPDTMSPGSAYGEGKRVAELLCAIYHRQHGIQTKIARCFAFVGPHLPLDKHFAIGNFIRDQLRGEPLRIQGDGTPYRSYLYAADLAVWLWTILFRGPACTPFNVGSEDAHTIREVAEAVTAALGAPQPVAVSRAAPEGGPRQRYVPSTQATRALLGLGPGVPLPDAIRKTAAWYEEER